MADTEDILHRGQPAVVVVKRARGGARLDERADEHAARIAAARGRVGGVVQRVRGLTRSQVAWSPFCTQGDGADGTSGCDRGAVLVDELQRTIDDGPAV